MNVFTNLLLAIVLTTGSNAADKPEQTAVNNNDNVCMTPADAVDSGIVYGVETNDRMMEMVGRIA